MEDNLEKIYDDTTAWYYFEGHDESETIGVYARCPVCSRYIKKGEVSMNAFGDLKLAKWRCNKHGEVQPYTDRINKND